MRDSLPYLFVYALTGIFLPMGECAAAEKEIRAIWVTRWDYKTTADIRVIFSNCHSLGLNRVYFQVRGRSDAFYKSNLEPWAEELGGKDPGFDPLEVAIVEARKNSLELHAWVNVLAGWKGRKPPGNKTHLFHTHPDWFLKDRSGKTWKLSEHYTMLNPCNSQVREHVSAVAGDIAARYRIDGIHLDYIRFVFPVEDQRDQVPYDNVTLSLFRKETTGFPSRYPVRWNEFRRRAINSVVSRISSRVRKARPGCIVSAAVIRDLKRGKEVFFQDSPAWIANGWIDEVVPMNYELNHARFERLAKSDSGLAGGSQTIAGLGAYLYKTGTDLRRQVEIARRLKSPGYALFAYTSFFPTPSHASDQGETTRRARESLRTELTRLNQR
jgi:uncharacterized lipoprotein YddW (UPF0748 family)